MNHVFSGRKQKRTKSKNHSGENSAVSDVWTTFYKSNVLDEKMLPLCPGTAEPREQPGITRAAPPAQSRRSILTSKSSFHFRIVACL